MKINGKQVKTNGFFAYEGCHKIYICEDSADIKMMKQYGYEILPIASLREVYEGSCSLKFINNAKLTIVYAPQGKNAIFEDKMNEK